MALQSFEHASQALVAHASDKIEVNPGILERAAKAQHERKFVRGQFVAVSDQRRREIVSRVGAKLGIGHGLFGEALQDLEANWTVIGRNHVSIVLCERWYCLSRARLYILRAKAPANDVAGTPVRNRD